MSESDRGQLSTSLVEVAIGVVFVFAVTVGFAIGVPSPDTESAQLDAYATDTATVLANEPPRHAGETRLSEVTRSPAAFERERGALEERVDRILDDNLMYRVVTPHGAVGYERPRNAPAGHATVPTAGGEVTVWVWYA